jgi:hypothetical protein
VRLHALPWLAAASALSACMTVQIESRDAEVRVVRHFGLLQIDLQSPDKALVGAISGVGVAATPFGWSAGFTRQRWAAMGPQCRAVLWVERGAVDATTREALSAVAGVCLAEEGLATATAQHNESTMKKGSTP